MNVKVLTWTFFLLSFSTITALAQTTPSFASSVDGEHATGLAGDGNPNTWWQPKSDDKAPFWILDTEKGLDIVTVKLLFAQEAVYQYTIDVSSDWENWIVIFDNSQSAQKETDRLIKAPKNTIGRFVRIRFLSTDISPVPKISEVEVAGIVID